MSLNAAEELRSKGAELAKDKSESRVPGFSGMYFGRCTTLSTRIRCDVSLLVN